MKNNNWLENIQLEDMQGVCFQNTKLSEKSPDFRGIVQIDGKKYEIAGWAGRSKKGKRFLSMRLSEDGTSRAIEQVGPARSPKEKAAAQSKRKVQKKRKTDRATQPSRTRRADKGAVSSDYEVSSP